MEGYNVDVVLCFAGFDPPSPPAQPAFYPKAISLQKLMPRRDVVPVHPPAAIALVLFPEIWQGQCAVPYVNFNSAARAPGVESAYRQHLDAP